MAEFPKWIIENTDNNDLRQHKKLMDIDITTLAFPIISLILELIAGRVKLSSLGLYGLIGFILMATGMRFLFIN